MARSRAMVDLTLDSEDEGRIKAGSKSSQKARGGLSLKKESRPQAKDHRQSQKESSPNVSNAEPGQSGSKYRTSINTRETAFDLTADDEEAPQLRGGSTHRPVRADPARQAGAAVNVKGNKNPAREDVNKFESPSETDQSKSVTSKRRTMPLTRPSPVQGDLGRSVAFRPPPHGSLTTPEDGRSKRSEPEGGDPTQKARMKKAAQKSSPGPEPVPSSSTVKKSSSKKSGRSSRDAHGELTPYVLRTTHCGKTLAAESLSKSGSPAPSPTSKSSKRTVNTKKPHLGELISQESPQPTVSVGTDEAKSFREGTLGAVEEPSAARRVWVQNTTSPQFWHLLYPPVHQQQPEDEQAELGSTSKREPLVQVVETTKGADPLNGTAGTSATRSASCTENDPSLSNGDALMQPRNKKVTVKEQRAEHTRSPLRPDEARVASPTLQALKISAETPVCLAAPTGVVDEGTKTMAAAMVAKQNLRSNTAGGFVSEPAIDLRTSTSQPDMEQCMRRHLKELHENHAYFMKAWLGRARKACDRRATAMRLPYLGLGLDHAAGSMTVPEEYVQTKSPFAKMKPLRAPLTGKEIHVQTLTGRLQQQILRVPKPVRPIEEMPVTIYASDAVSVPPYLNYIPIRRNILAENDRSLKYYPYFGEDGPGKKLGLEKELEERFNDRIKHLPFRHWCAEQADKLLPYTRRYLEQLSCEFSDVLYLFLDTNHPRKPGEGSSGTSQDWYAACFAAESDRASKKWQTLFCSMQSPGQQALARAELACKAFYTATKLSLWYIVKNHDVTVNLLARLQEKGDSPYSTQGLHTYTDLGCLMCHVHDCPCHGEYEEPSGEKDIDGKNAASKDDSNPEDADSDSDNGLTHNLRKRVVAEPRMLRDQRTHRGPVAYNDNDVESVQDFFGMDDDGTISGTWNRTGDRGNSGFPDTELCSTQCFWKKANRTAKTSKWSEGQLDLLRNLLPAYIASRRGPCMMTYAFNKPCQEVFNKMRSISSTAPPQDEMPTTLPHAGNGRPNPRRGWQYWQKNSVTHIHEERDPFRPCSHEGSCQDAVCPCYRANITCEKSCQCAHSCERRFHGCNCAQGNQVCWMSERCDCYQLNRECDPDLCGSCQACEVLDPVNRYDEKATHRKCANVYMQRGVPKRTLMGHSDIQGWGLYIGEDVKANEFLGEYKGEIVSKTEGDRRGAVYHHRGIEYLFGLNKTQEIDSTRAGNKMRFINNSKKHINCYPRKVLCNTVQRIGMYAKRDLVSGEELYFDYGYPVEVTKNFWDKGEPKMAAAATAKKEGKTTAVKQEAVAKAEKSRGRRGARLPKHGGARNGAGRKARAIKASSGPSGKRADGGDGRGEGGDACAVDPAGDEVEEMDVVESEGEGDGDDDAVSEVDPFALEESESEDDSYASADEVEVEVGRKRGNRSRSKSKVSGRVGGSAQKRGWITRKENLKRKRGY